MNEPSFLARKTCGLSNYFLIALVVAFLVAMIPRGARRAVEGNTNNAKDWLPPSYAESVDLRWFQQHFVGEHFALVTFDGCTLANDERLKLLAKKLVPGGTAPLANAANDEAVDPADEPAAPPQDHHRWFKRVMTGRSMVEQLTQPPTELSESEAYRRLEGALLGPRGRDDTGQLLPQDSRTTCLVVTLSEESMRSNQNMRKAIESVKTIATEQCSIPLEKLRMGGPPVDNVAIDIEGERTLMRLAVLSGIVGLMLSYWCFRSIKLTGMVFAVGVVSAGMSLALVFYYGVYEVFGLGMQRPRLGTVDAILMSMPSVVYVLGLSGAIHIVNYYKDARRERGRKGAAETAVAHGWGPCTLAALTTAVGLASLHTSDITPIKKFGTFTAVGVIGTLGILFSVLPVALHRFPLGDRELKVGEKDSSGAVRGFSFSALLQRVGGFVVRHNTAVCCFWLAVMGFLSLGLWKIETSVQLLKLFDEDADIIRDYAWLEANLGNLVPMEVVLTLDPAQICSGEREDDPEENGMCYRMSPAERVAMIRRFHEVVESLPDIGKAMSVATFVRDIGDYKGPARFAAEAVLNRQMEDSREALNDYLKQERRFVDGDVTDEYTGREIWRISARARALDDAQGEEMDYGTFIHELREAVDPLVLAYRQRDEVLRQLHEQGKQLAESKLLILFRSPDTEARLPKDTQEGLLRELLLEAHAEEVPVLNLAKLDSPKGDQIRTALKRSLPSLELDAAVIVSVGHDPAAKKLTAGLLPLIDVSKLHETAASPRGSPVLWKVAADAPLPMGAVYTGVVPLVYKTQRELLVSLQESITWASGLIALVMVFVLRSPAAGLISMIPNVFPIIVVFGALGWLGIKVDIGIMMTASVALGVAVDDTIHFVWWFRKGIRGGMSRHASTLFAYERCGTAMTQTTIIAGLGLAVFATSTFTPTQQFGYLMITMLSAALVGDLLLLPAILSGPIGKFFCGRLAPTAEPPVDGPPPGKNMLTPSDPAQAAAEPAHPILHAPHVQDIPRRSAQAS